MEKKRNTFSAEPIPGYFEVFFVVSRRSLYREAYSFRSGMSQEQVLAYDYDDIERMMNVRDVVETSPDKPHLFHENLLEEDCFLGEIITGERKRISCVFLKVATSYVV